MFLSKSSVLFLPPLPACFLPFFLSLSGLLLRDGGAAIDFGALLCSPHCGGSPPYQGECVVRNRRELKAMYTRALPFELTRA